MIRRILIVDDHPIVAQGFRTMLEPRYEVVGVVQHAAEVLAACQHLKPDLVLLDLSLPGGSGLGVLRDLKEKLPTIRVLVVTMHDEKVYADEAVNAGADGFVVKSAPPAEVRLAIEEIAAGRQYVTHDLTRSTSTRFRSADDIDEMVNDPVARLTDRQKEVLRLVGRGLSNAEIAESLGLSVKVIEYHRAALRSVLSLNSQAALIRFAALHFGEEGE